MRKNNSHKYIEAFRSTTVIAVHRNGKIAMAADGQVTLGQTVMKHQAKKLQKLYDGKILVGFAGAAADAMTLVERFEEKLNKFNGNLRRSAVELAKDWRTDRILRKLEALIAVADKNELLVISGTGEIIEPDDGIAAIGSGGPYALAAARGLVQSSSLNAAEIAKKSLEIASEICIYTNNKITLEEL